MCGVSFLFQAEQCSIASIAQTWSIHLSTYGRLGCFSLLAIVHAFHFYWFLPIFINCTHQQTEVYFKLLN